LGERRELEVLLASVKESEKTKKESEYRDKVREREPPRRTGEPCFEEGKKTEKELRRERERGKLRSKQKSMHEKGKDREYDVTRAAHVSTQWYAVTVRLSLPGPDSTSSNMFVCRETQYFLDRRQCRGKVPVVLTLVSELQHAHCSTPFLSISKALSHDSAATHLKMYPWIDTECRKPQMGAQCQQTNNV